MAVSPAVTAKHAMVFQRHWTALACFYHPVFAVQTTDALEDPVWAPIYPSLGPVVEKG